MGDLVANLFEPAQSQPRRRRAVGPRAPLAEIVTEMQMVAEG